MKHRGRKHYPLFGWLDLLGVYFILRSERALMWYAFLFVTVLALDFVRLRVLFNSESCGGTSRTLHRFSLLHDRRVLRFVHFCRYIP
jgi:hypothetical protein